MYLHIIPTRIFRVRPATDERAARGALNLNRPEKHYLYLRAREEREDEKKMVPRPRTAAYIAAAAEVVTNLEMRFHTHSQIRRI